MSLEQAVLDEARNLGFAAAGIAAAGPSAGMEAFRSWLASGAAAGLAYLRRNLELRADPRCLAPGTRSVIVVAARYPVNPAAGTGFSTYARGAENGVVVRARLKRLAERLRSLTPVGAARVCVDSAPVLEREWAARAGVGWRGRQGQIVHPAFGCCLFLGELLVDLDLAPTAPIEDRCGDCRRCVEACPTGAIGADGLLDARRCISYLTIEHSGAIAAELQPRLGGALYGCDRCTAVCPFNRPGDDAVLPELRPRLMPTAEECRTMTAAAFAARFRDTAVLRMGLERLRRNAAIAGANARRSS